MPAESPTDAILTKIDKMASDYKADNKTLTSRLDDMEKKAMAPQYPNGMDPSRLFHATSGPVGRDSAGYSLFKAAGVAKGYIAAEDAKEEIHASNQLKALYKGYGYQPHYQAASFLVPYSTDHIPQMEPAGQKLAGELRVKQMASVKGYDPDEAAWIRRKAMGTVTDTAGASLVGFPTLGELIDLQRNMEVFNRAGARDVTLPPNAMIDYPKLTGGSTAYWVGEGSGLTASDETTGTLKLIGKKLAVIVKVNNELFRYANPSSEGMIRNDMAMQAALKADLAMLEGTGGTQPKGLITYATASSWSQGTDALLTYSVTSNVIQPQDITKMIGLLPDQVQDLPLTFIMRNDLWGALSARRADAITAADQAGPFVFNLTRSAGEKIPKELAGQSVVTSSQVSNTRSTSKTYVLAGAFQDWIVGRFGVMEFLASNSGTGTNSPFENDQTWLRAIQILDAGARHPASFVFADNVNIA